MGPCFHYCQTDGENSHFGINIYSNARQYSPKIKLVVGPFTHSAPEDNSPGPGFDGKSDMVSWFDYWLKGHDTGILAEPDLTLFIRNGTSAGEYRYYDHWPLNKMKSKRFFMMKNKKLEDTTSSWVMSSDKLEYKPWIGFEAGYWWGSSIDLDQSKYDRDCLVYESDVLQYAIEIIGYVNVSLQVSTTSKLAHWMIRLEDVYNQTAIMVTGGALNGAQRNNRSNPEYFIPNQIYNLTFRLHFTTWTFLPQHQIRLSISNAYFFTHWPTPEPMTTTIYHNPITYIDLPVISHCHSSASPIIPLFTQKSVDPSDEMYLNKLVYKSEPKIYYKTDTDFDTTITYETNTHQTINHIQIQSNLSFNFTCSHIDPSNVTWITQAKHFYRFLSTNRTLELITNMNVYSDNAYFYTNLNRLLTDNSQIKQQQLNYQFFGKQKRQFQ
ncbi:unnamed protein product [Didymodactylos carnosus]|uniref:Xaa-Pro dipeptidyl-peptidase C-terminal domain-containing protein n=1 Tax=Didymodactylos carnosus TaxID=1234261 RepID=A0A815ENW2_9BILA|nr:unnamed protein product [Didymodactylos carnosus]CAF1317838.1 unnamed protein product [Didymodactylos carnosus]CAF3899218.1 unnamed protein product [Didymodactylos carnosus]CAF4161256.1 unnamed protein product [Didymodactylos carnosus]